MTARSGALTAGVLATTLFLVLMGSGPAIAADPPPWSSPQLLSASGGSDSDPRLVETTDGMLVGVWRHDLAVEASMSADGYSWSSPIDISGTGANDRDPRLTTGADGSALVSWYRVLGTTSLIQVTRFDGDSWGDPVTVATASGGTAQPAIAADSSGNAFLAWRTGNNIEASTSADGGVTWTTPVVIGSGGTNSMPQVATRGGKAVATWSSLVSGSNVVRASVYTPGSGWAGATTVSNLPQNNGHQVAAGGTGFVAIWWAISGADLIIQTAHHDGTAWSAPTAISTPASNAGNPQVATNPADGTYLATWWRAVGSDFAVETSTSADGLTWSTSTLTSAAGSTSDTRLNVAADGTSAIAWRRFTAAGFVVQSALSDGAGGWTTVTDLSTAPTSAFTPQILARSGGHAVALWQRDDAIESAFTMTAPSITSAAPGAARVGEPYSFQITATGNPPPTFAVTSGALPDGLSLSSAGAITGTPTSTASASFTVTASNGALPAASVTLTLEPLPALVAPAITSGAPAAPTVGEPYSFQVTATGNPLPTFAITSGSLPAGLSLTAAGLISGTPTTVGDATFTIIATNGVGTDASALYTLAVAAAPSPSPGPASSSGGTSTVSGLPATGADPLPLIVTGIVALGLGAVLFGAARYRRG